MNYAGIRQLMAAFSFVSKFSLRILHVLYPLSLYLKGVRVPNFPNKSIRAGKAYAVK